MRLKQLALLALLVVVALSGSGCFLRALLGGEVVETLSEEIDHVISALQANVTTGVCRQSPFTGLIECTYVFADPEGFLGTTTSTTQLVSEFGIFGAIVDPVVLELPAAATEVAGTYDDGAGASGALVVYPGLSFVAVDDNRRISASAGKQLVIVDLPDGAAVDGVTYRFNLAFEQKVPVGTGPTPVKALLTGKLKVGTKTFYPPVLPCTADLSTVPALTLPRSATMLPLSVPQGLPGCANQLYTYFRAPRVCDLDNDHVVNRTDLDLIEAMSGTDVDPGDPRDTNGDGVVDAKDVALCAAQCAGPGCGPASTTVAVTSGQAYNFEQTDRGFVRIVGQFLSSTTLDLGASGITATLIDSLLEKGGGELVHGLPVTIPARTRGDRVTVFEKLSGQTLYRLIVRTCVPAREACPNSRGVDVGEYEFRIELVNVLVHAPAQCGAPGGPKTTSMTTRFVIDDGIHPPVEAVIPDSAWGCTFRKNRVVSIRVPPSP
jgi:hypothetical protein